MRITNIPGRYLSSCVLGELAFDVSRGHCVFVDGDPPDVAGLIAMEELLAALSRVGDYSVLEGMVAGLSDVPAGQITMSTVEDESHDAEGHGLPGDADESYDVEDHDIGGDRGVASDLQGSPLLDRVAEEVQSTTDDNKCELREYVLAFLRKAAKHTSGGKMHISSDTESLVSSIVADVEREMDGLEGRFDHGFVTLEHGLERCTWRPRSQRRASVAAEQPPGGAPPVSRWGIFLASISFLFLSHLEYETQATKAGVGLRYSANDD